MDRIQRVRSQAYPHLTEEEKKKKIQQKLAEEYTGKSDHDEKLPPLPTDRVEWELYCRPRIKGEANRIRFLPMIRKVIVDMHPFKMLLWARQWGKTTEFASDLAYDASIHEAFDQTYINFEEEALKTFSENKFRKDVFNSWPLSEYIQGISKWGSMRKVQLKTGSTIDLITSLRNWKHALGKSNKKLAIDEGQDHDWTGWFDLRETQADTMGSTLIGGIGGFEDTQYHRIWKSTNQMEWIFDHSEEYKGYPNMSWRRELERNCFDENGLVYDQAMLDVLAGEWTPQAPKNYSRHGYHLSQLQNPRIPLTIRDAEELYHVPGEFSIEYKMNDPDITESEFDRNVLARFVTGETKPITEAMMYKLIDKNIGFVASEEVDHSLGEVFGGADWGGGPKTVVWVMQCINEAYPIFRLLFAVRLEGQTSDEQYHTARNIFEAYGTKQNVVDAGGGTHQVEQLQRYFGTRCVRNYYMRRPARPLPITTSEIKKHSLHNMFEIDKTYHLDACVDLIKIPSSNGPRLILPGKNFREIEWVIKQFVNEEVEFVKTVGGAQSLRRYYTPDPKLKPDDALHAFGFARLAWFISRRKGGHWGGAILGADTDDNDLDIV